MNCLKNSKEDFVAQRLFDNQRFLNGLRASWAADYRDSAFLKDIPRLIKRVYVQTTDFRTHTPPLEDSKVEAILSVLDVISSDTGFDLDKMTMIRNSISNEKLTDDGAVKYIFENLGSESKIVKLLSLINQGIVLSGIQVLKESVCTDIMTKDVRTPDGWRIGIKLGDAIQLIHHRTEQSLDEFGDRRNHFEFEWEIVISFDKQLEQLRSATLRIVRLTTADTMDPAHLKYLRHKLIEGLIVI
mmetsp:Transcript_2096/g.3264  ORF Transcript_2096/g.3264 Transcript_2096/m.3264 type:complete len:243 (+) Transcript_2096:46-774(+)